MKKRLIALALTVVFLFSGCSLVSVDSDNLLYPPRPAGEQAEIQGALEKHIGTHFTLKYPRSGEICSAITQVDLDYDGEEEVVAFYRTKTETGGTHFVLMDRIDGEWKVQSDLVGPGVDVDRLVITQFGTGEQKSVLVGWILFNSDKIGTVYTYRDGRVISSLSDHIYTEMLVNDFDQDGTDELFTLLLNSSGQTSTARLFSKNPDTDLMENVSELQLDGNISSYARIRFGQVETGGARGVVIDENKSASAVKTEIVYWDDTLGELVLAAFSQNQNQDVELLRETTTLSGDLSGDGIIDIPFPEWVYRVPNEEESNPYELAESVYTRWKNYRAADHTFVNVLDTAINYPDGYYLVIPEERDWVLHAYFLIDKETRTMTFRNREQNWEMFRIRAFSESEWEKTGKNEYFEITRGNGLVYGGWVSAKLQSEFNGREADFFRKNVHLIGSAG
ncbi:MAG: hypothetical protein PUC59_00755 [Firmicutes bacterium]|nr:hypothetical protein [Bacillota bacterium]